MQLQPLTVAVLVLLTLPAPAATATNFCPTYNTVIVVDFVNTTPRTATEGTIISTTFRATYPEGTPASIKNASFIWTGPRGREEYDNVAVAPNGTAGFYTYTQEATPDLIHVVGRGRVTVSIIACSVRDGYGNDGPNQNTDSITLTKTRHAAQRYRDNAPRPTLELSHSER